MVGTDRSLRSPPVRQPLAPMRGLHSGSLLTGGLQAGALGPHSQESTLPWPAQHGTRPLSPQLGQGADPPGLAFRIWTPRTRAMERHMP